ncbi:MAG: hypothetical protein CBE34_01490 [bacterium TMED274]|nr:MAG: hypothetical protein CBE34_01490 [bacterium TMED274]
MGSYFKFFLTPLFLCIMGLSLIIDGWMGLSLSLVVVCSIIFGELFFGDDISTPNYRFPFLLDFSLFINVPLFLIVLYLFLDRVSSAFEWYYLLYIPILGLLMALSLINIGHELVHRTSKKFDCEVGNWALATAWNPAFAIEHVYGHHKNIGIVEEDPVTATYGENPIIFAVKAFFKEHVHAWGIETRQLNRRKQRILSFHNRILNGYLRTLIVFGLIGYFFSWQAMLIYICLGIVANYIFQLTNFIEHYGLVRIKGKPVQYHHSWNSNNRMTSYLTYNLTRHSDHHVHAQKEFWELNPCDNTGVVLPSGYLTYILLFTFFPSYAKSQMAPRLKHWHENYASVDEKALTLHYLNFSI